MTFGITVIYIWRKYKSEQTKEGSDYLNNQWDKGARWSVCKLTLLTKVGVTLNTLTHTNPPEILDFKPILATGQHVVAAILFTDPVPREALGTI